jgi:hypothetical protein
MKAASAAASSGDTSSSCVRACVGVHSTVEEVAWEWRLAPAAAQACAAGARLRGNQPACAGGDAHLVAAPHAASLCEAALIFRVAVGGLRLRQRGSNGVCGDLQQRRQGQAGGRRAHALRTRTALHAAPHTRQRQLQAPLPPQR